MSALKAEGITIIVVIVVVFIVFFILGVYCHFCAETDSGGHYYNSNENIASVVFVKKGEGPKCKCSKHFKGSCKHCEGEGFVDDGNDGKYPDFTGFGGDKGLDPGWGENNTDPLRSALGGGGAGGDASGGMTMRDD